MIFGVSSKAFIGKKRQFGLVFDVDGVLFDSRQSNMKFYNLIRRAVHLPPLNAEEEEYCHMVSAPEAFIKIIPPELTAKAQLAMKQIDYQTQILPMLTPEPGLLEALHWLKSNDVKLGVFTNRSNSVSVLLHSFGLDQFFSPIKTAQSCKPKPHPQGLLEVIDEWKIPASQMAFLGDSLVDEQAAYSAGVPFWGFNNSLLNADLHISNYYEFINLLGTIMEPNT